MDERHVNRDPVETDEDYTGHELDGETGLHYAGARYYMAALGRWNSVDPLADDFPAWSPYTYSYNNPLGFTDPTGMAPQDEWRVDRNTGTIEKVSNEGGDQVDTYHIGQYVGGKTNFAVARTVEINRSGTGSQINAFRIEHGQDHERTVEGNSEGYTLSTFHSPTHSALKGVAVEPGGPSTTTSDQDKRIPEGRYDIDPQAEGTYEIGLSNENVSVDRGIKMHPGNYGRHTEGCWMPTPGLADRAGAGGSRD